MNTVPEKNTDPNAPEGWPLAIGEPDIKPWGRPWQRGVADDFERWTGNCCINWVDGVPYTAEWHMGEKDGLPWNFYKGHVPAEDRHKNRGDYSISPDFHLKKR